ncbi:MAG: hypothetical protein L0226_04520 [Acidobacteria bacterium]|nr:hypothetical protein [Acidobacteriota bacterium]
MLRGVLPLICLITLMCSVSYGQSREQGAFIPEGTEIQLTLKEPLSSKLNEPGDEVIATLRRDIVIDGYKLLREGTEFIGRVTLAQPAGRPFKGGQLHITFERVRIDGSEQKLYAAVKSASDFTRDEKVKGDSEGTLKGGTDGGKILTNVGTAAGIGGIGASIIILSSIKDGPRGGGISSGGGAAGAAVLGGSAAAGVILTKGKEVRLDPNTIIRLKLEKALVVE